MPCYVLHFTHAGNDKMKCRYCQEDIKFTNSHLHSSNLRNHLTFKHPGNLSVPEKAKVPKMDDYFTGHKSSLPSLPALDRQTLAVCCSAHPLPFNLVEDKVFQWAYNCPVKDRRRISIRVTELARDWREKIGVERAFSRLKLFHSNLRANLKAEKLHEQLFLRYNFQNKIDTASTVNQSHGESDDDDDFLPFE